MSKLEKLQAKPKTITIEDVVIELKPITLRDLDIIMELTDEKTRNSAYKKLITSSLRNSIPDATEDEINNFSIKYFQPLILAILDVNDIQLDAETKKKLDVTAASS